METKVKKQRAKRKASEAIDEAFTYVRGLEKISEIPEAMKPQHMASIREAWAKFDELKAERIR